MSGADRHDVWAAGESYDHYMGRWSRMMAPRFLDWLAAPGGADWIEVGCGTGALTAAILGRAGPRSLLAVEPSADFLALARREIVDPRAAFVAGEAAALPSAAASRDVAVAGLVLNFVPDRAGALAEMRRVLRSGGRLGFYVWDYPGGGMGILRAFWQAAVALDPAAEDLAEARRFPFCTPEALGLQARDAGFVAVETAALEGAAVFRDFDDFWRPFTLGAGPAPGYCASLAPEARERLRTFLDAGLRRRADGAIELPARAWAVRAQAP